MAIASIELSLFLSSFSLLSPVLCHSELTARVALNPGGSIALSSATAEASCLPPPPPAGARTRKGRREEDIEIDRSATFFEGKKGRKEGAAAAAAAAIPISGACRECELDVL